MGCALTVRRVRGLDLALATLLSCFLAADSRAQDNQNTEPPLTGFSGTDKMDWSGLDSIGPGLVTLEVLYGVILVAPSAMLLGLNARDVALRQKPVNAARGVSYLLSPLAVLGGVGFICLGASDGVRGPIVDAGFALGIAGTAFGVVNLGLAIAGEFMPDRKGRPLPTVSVAPTRGGAFVGLTGRF